MDATSDIRSGGGPGSSNSQSQVPSHSSNNVNSFSKSHLSISQDPQVDEASGDENEFEVEPSKLLEQTLTTDNVPSSSQNSTGHIQLPSVSGLEISRRSMSSTDSLSQALVPASDSLGSNLQAPDSPQDIKPQILSFDDPPISPVAGPSHSSERSMMMYMDQTGVASIPGPSNYQDNSALVPHDSQPQGNVRIRNCRKRVRNGDQFLCFDCTYSTNDNGAIQKHIKIVHRTHTKAKKNKDSERFVCCQCPFKSNSEDDISRHLMTHGSDLNFDCYLCGKKFYLREDLSAHLKTHSSNEAKYPCGYVNKEYHQLLGLLASTIESIPEEDFCQRVFPIANLLQLKHFETMAKYPKVAARLVTFLSKVEQNGPKDLIHTIMSLVLTNDMYPLYSYYGRKGKHAFNELKLNKIVIMAVQENFNATTSYEIGQIIGKFLARAGRRRKSLRMSIDCMSNGETKKHE